MNTSEHFTESAKDTALNDFAIRVENSKLNPYRLSHFARDKVPENLFVFLYF